MLKITIMEFLILLAILMLIVGSLLDWFDRGERQRDEDVAPFDAFDVQAVAEQIANAAWKSYEKGEKK